MADLSLVEERGLELPAEGIALAGTRGAAVVVAIQIAVNALDRPGLALRHAALTWRSPRGVPCRRRVRLHGEGRGSWDAAHARRLAECRRAASSAPR